MRKNSAQTGQIVDFIYAKTDSTATGNLISSPSAHNISDTEVQIVDSKSPTLAYDNLADAIQIVQGTPNSTALYNVDPFGTGYPDVEKSGILKKGNVLSVSKYEYAPARYQVLEMDFTSATISDYTEANGYPVYQSVFTMQSTRGDITYGMNKEVFSFSYTPPKSSASIGGFIQNFVVEANKFSSVVGNITKTGGTKPFIVLALEPTTTETESIGALTLGSTFTFATYDGVNVTYKVDETMFNTIAEAITSNPALHAFDGVPAFTGGYKIVNANTATFSGNELVLIIALDEKPVLAFDDIMELKTTLDVGVSDGNVTGDMAYTKTELSEPFEGTGLGRQVLLWYRSKAKLQKFNMQNHPIHGEFFINQDLPEYFTTDGKYSLTIIDYIDTVDTINGTTTHPKQVVIVHDVTSVTEADATNGYIKGIHSGSVVIGLSVLTKATVTFENDLTAWIAASNSVKTIDFLGTATVSNVTFG